MGISTIFQLKMELPLKCPEVVNIFSAGGKFHLSGHLPGSRPLTEISEGLRRQSRFSLVNILTKIKNGLADPAETSHQYIEKIDLHFRMILARYVLRKTLRIIRGGESAAAAGP
jgi:hypothetical protein